MDGKCSIGWVMALIGRVGYVRQLMARHRKAQGG